MIRFRSRKFAGLLVGLLLSASPLALAETSTGAPAGEKSSTSVATPAASSPGPVREETREDRNQRTARNAIFVELGGPGILYSLNYDRMIEEWVSVRAGFMYLSLNAASSSSSARASLLLIPVTGNFFVGANDHKLELGLGPLFAYASAAVSDNNSTKISGDGFAVGGTGCVGYRYAPKDGGFFFRVGFTPIFGSGGFLPWGGISLGGIF